VKDLQEDYTKKGFDEKLKEETLAAMHAKKPMKAAKKGTLKEKKDAMASLLNTVVERTEGMNDAWEHFASADPAFANVASYRNTEKTCPKGGMMAQRNEAVAYETRNKNKKGGFFNVQNISTQVTWTAAWTCLRSNSTELLRLLKKLAKIECGEEIKWNLASLEQTNIKILASSAHFILCCTLDIC